jgi:LysM repeat protein
MHAQLSVTTWRNDISRTGQNLNETILNTSDVNPTQFGKLFSQAVDGYVYAQPLYLQNVAISGASHNVVFVATEHDSVYAFDADSNGGANANPLWFASMLTSAHGAAAGATTVSSNDVGTDIVPEVGITGTPVIDPSSGTLYVVSATNEGTAFVQRLHALDITSGAEKFGGPVVITATVSGTGSGSSGGSLTFDPEWENQRPGLLLLNGIVYVAFASHGDAGPWHGWIMGYNAQTLMQTGAFCTSANGVGSGVWMGGSGLAAEVVDPVNHPYGRMFVATGNGDYTATTPYAAGMDYGDSVLDLDLTNGVPTITDEFTPSNQASLDANDGDEGSGGVLIVPNQTTGSYPHLLVQAGKWGEVYLLNRENLGGYNTAGDQVVQELPYTVGQFGTWTSPAYWNGTVYYWGQIDTLKAFPLVNGQLTGPTATSSESYGFPGANPSISANGNTQGIVWTIDSEAYQTQGPSVLQAHDASNPGTTLYSSSTNATRDNPGLAVKFTVPTVVNGKVYVGAQGQLSVYGLLNGEQLAAAPTLSPGAESFSGSLAVTISDAITGATIYYTLDGSTPTVASAVYSTPITITATTTIRAIASAAGYLQSAVTSATYVDSVQAATPTFNPGGGTFAQPLSVTISDSTAGATIYYTTDGTTPTTSSTQYTGSVLVSTTETLKAIAVASGLINSSVASAAYTVNIGQTGINFPVGFAGTAGIMILNGSTDLDDTRLQLTNGGLGEAGSAWYYQQVNVQAFTTSFSFQLSNPAGDGITFAIQGNNVYSLGNSGSGLGYQGIANSVGIKFDLYDNAGEGPDSTGLYINGASPTVPAIDLSTTGINLHSDDTMEIDLAYNGTVLSMTVTDMVTGAAYSTNWTVNIPSIVGGSTAYVGFTGGTGGVTSSQKILNWVYTIGSSAPPVLMSPLFSPSGGTYSTAQSVSITSGSAGATIYYTTDGSTPTTSSAVYSSAINVHATETLQAVAVKTGYTNSAVAAAAYTIGAALPAPTFSPAAGTYTTSQLVSISDATAGTTIYYTTNGATPTTSSTVYSGPITVSATESLEAIAVEAGYTNSPVATAAYTIALVLPAPMFSPAGGTYTTSQLVTISDATAGTTIYYTTNGATPTTSSMEYSGPITVSATETLEAIAVEAGYTNSPVATAAYTIVPVLPMPTFSPAGGMYTTSQLVTISDATAGTTIYYTTNGTTPTTSSSMYSGPITVSATETLEAIAVEKGYTNSPVATAAYTIAPVLPMPMFSPAGGMYTTSQLVTISDATAGTTIYYTTNGTTPTTSSSMYSGPITVSATETLEAIAVEKGYTNSPVATTAYTIAPVLPMPMFSPAGGTYTAPQSVTISDSTGGTTIYYTTNRTTPTTSSARYTGAITVSATETLEAIAVEAGYTNSAVDTAAYTINLPTEITPAVKITPSSSSISTNQTLTVTVAVSGGTGNPTPTGSVIVTSGNYSSTATPLSDGSATINVPAGSLSTGSDTLTASYTPDAASASIYNGTSNTATVTVTTADYSLVATAVTVAPGAPGTSTITVSSNTGYAGTVTLTCAVTSSPTGATDLPTCVGGQAMTLTSGTQSGTSTVTVNTTAAISSALPGPRPGKGWGGAGAGVALAFLAFLWIPARQRKWQSMLGVLAVIVVLESLAGCGGISRSNTTTNLGTTAGNYTVTVTGTGNDAAKTIEKTTFTLTVN